MKKSTTPEQLATKNYWDAIYQTREGLSPVDLDKRHARCFREIYSIKEKLGLDSKRVLEIGGAGSSWLAFLASSVKSSVFTCLDYSEKGVESLKRYAKENDINNLEFIVADMFDPPKEGAVFDLIYSHGVVEHFPDLPVVLAAHARYLSDEGVMLTIIPNMAGVLGTLTKLFDRKIFEMHVPHDIASFRRGHDDAGLSIIESGYICSNNFGVLSSCFQRKEGWKWKAYKFLSRLSKAIWMFEEKVVSLPRSKAFSPYIYIVSKKGTAFSK